MVDTVNYSQIASFLKQRERVLICLPAGNEADRVARAVSSAGCIPVLWGPDYTWKALLRQCFSEGIRVVAGHSSCILGLGKMATALKTPLRIRSALITHGPCPAWMVGGIAKRLDCRVLNLSTQEDDLEPAFLALTQELLGWTSVLDLRLNRQAQGLELELVFFPGEKLPRLPSVARQAVRPLKVDSDCPFFLQNFWENH